MFIYELNFSFKMLSEEYFGEKNPRFFTGRPFFHMVYVFEVCSDWLVLLRKPYCKSFLTPDYKRNDLIY